MVVPVIDLPRVERLQSTKSREVSDHNIRCPRRQEGIVTTLVHEQIAMVHEECKENGAQQVPSHRILLQRPYPGARQANIDKQSTDSNNVRERNFSCLRIAM